MSATPTVYFIDDSATMREVIKIAFRRENINVVAYNDAATALGQLEVLRPDVVITDVIMPDKDGYEVCQYIKQHPTMGNIPVILMSGVVNRTVAEKAFSVKADELIRKPFQPQDLITRVRHLVQPGGPPPMATPAVAASAAAALSNIFKAPPVAASTAQPAARPRVPVPTMAPPQAYVSPAPSPYAQQPHVPVPVAVATAAAPAMPVRAPIARTAISGSADVAKLRLELMRLEGLVRKLQSELQAEREYAQALEAHVKTLQEAE